MVLKLPWAQKRNVLRVWKGHFPVFCKFLSDEVETVFWENNQLNQDQLNSKLVIASFLENGFSDLEIKKRMFWAFGKRNFQFFASFWLTKLKPFSGKMVQNYLNQNLFIGRFLENGFEDTSAQKRMFWAFEKGIF